MNTTDKITKWLSKRKLGGTCLEVVNGVDANEHTVRKILAGYSKLGKRKCRQSGSMLMSYGVGW